MTRGALKTTGKPSESALRVDRPFPSESVLSITVACKELDLTTLKLREAMTHYRRYELHEKV